MSSIDEKIRLARTAGADDIWGLLTERNPDVLSALVPNPNLSEEMAVVIAENRSTPPEALGVLAGDKRFRESYKVKLALCKNPYTPSRIALTLLRYLRVFDLADMTRAHYIPIPIRQRIENTIYEKIPVMPSGVKMTLAKRANSNVVVKLLESGADERVIQACLASPTLTEGDLYKLVNRRTTKSVIIKAIAEHPKWSLRYNIRYALIRNFETPMALVAGFVHAMKTADLRDLYTDRTMPASTRPYIYRELLEREVSVEPPAEEAYELPEDEDADFEE